MDSITLSICNFLKRWGFLLFFSLFILIGGYLLYNIVVVLPYTDMNQPQVHMS